MQTESDPYLSPPGPPDQRRTAPPHWDAREQGWDGGRDDGDAAAPRRAHARPPFLVSDLMENPYPLVAVPDRNAAGPRRRRSTLVALLVLALLGSIGWQAWQLDRLGDRLTSNDQQVRAALALERTRSAQAEARTAALERRAEGAFNSEAIATAVLPSVFRVRAGALIGTAFAVGSKAAGGTTNLLTNYHVVAAVWQAGNRRVRLERGQLRVSATLVKVDKDKDLAQLRIERDAAGLATARAEAKPGQPIVVVGAPFGLEDSVTTGVVSALRAETGGRRIQFDAPINPGNSGGPVINSAKQVVGVATAKARDAEGIGLAIPIETACDTFDIC